MASVVRVRGKRGNKRKTEVPGKRASKAAKHDHAAPSDASSLQPGLSRLEQLPTELLERICIWSGNINLVRCSPLLFSRLTSEHVKRGLMDLVFASKDDPELQGNGKILHASQQALLRTRWLTYSFLMQHKEQCLVDFAEEKLAAAVGPAVVEHAAEEMRKTLGKALAMTEKVPFEHYGKVKRDRAYSSLRVQQDLFYLNATETVDKIMFRPPWNPFRYGGPSNPFASIPFAASLSHESYSSRLRVIVNDVEHIAPPGRAYGARGPPVSWTNHIGDYPIVEKILYMPSRLLHGPWTSEQFNLLAYLTMEGIGVREVDRPLLRQGLSDALRELCIPAIVCLAGHPGLQASVEGLMDWRTPREDRVRINDPKPRGWYAPEASSVTWMWLEGLNRVDRQRCFVDVGLDHFELLFERARDLGKDAFTTLFHIMATAAVWAYSCTREELVHRALEAKSGERMAPWGTGLFGKDAVAVIDQVWDKAEHFRFHMKKERKVRA